MRKVIWIGTLLFLVQVINAQNSTKAREILDKVVQTLSESNGIRIDFSGTENGYLVLKGEKFYLNNNIIQSWYDGKTQWTYMADNEEVNISTPTPEELRYVNPYHMLKNFKSDYEYAYVGNTLKNNMTCHEIVLSNKSDLQTSFIVFVSENYKPLAIQTYQNKRLISDINIVGYSSNQKLKDETFVFNRTIFPNAEIIDLR